MALLSRGASRTAIALWVALALPACHTLVDGDLGVVACELEGGYGPPTCPAGQTCLGGTCASIGAAPGEPCADDSFCEGVCITPSTVGATGEPRCSRGCCGSQDCGPPELGQVCWSPPNLTGGMCWSAADLGRGALGHKLPGESCGGPADCRSGVCEGGECLDVCCSDAYCASSGRCRIRSSSASDGSTWTCGAPTGQDAQYCNSADDCATGACLDLGQGVQACAQPCCSSLDCARQFVDGEYLYVACVPATDFDGRVCGRMLGPDSSGAVGAPCSADADCRSGICITDDGPAYCSDQCCDDASCGDTSRFACRPRQSDATWDLRCVRK